MHMPRQAKTGLCLLSAAVILAGCSSNNVQNSSAYTAAELEQRNQILVEREKDLARREAEAKDARMHSAQAGDELLPPNAKSGECYARVWVEPSYKEYTELVLVKDASERLEIIPARYETVEETLQVQPASFKMTPVAAQYDRISEQKLVREAERVWRIDRPLKSAPASENLLAAASAHGIDLGLAEPGMCFHEHYLPARFEQVNESVLTKEAYDEVGVIPAQYRWVEKRVLVKQASTRIEETAAQYQTLTEQVIDVPAHTVWKKGTGPIQRIDAATGEIMCLVDVPATYKTVTKRVLASPATTRQVEIPAEYETVKVKELVSQPREERKAVAAEYSDVALTRKAAEASFVWHEVHNTEHPKATRTGNKICLTERPTQYETVERTVVVKQAGFEKTEIPAQFETIEVRKLVAYAQEKRFDIPAEYETVKLSRLEKDGFMEWRSILCETNMTVATIRDIQRALLAQGYNPGSIDGVVGVETMAAVNAFQRASSLPTDDYINMQTVNALQVKL
ncbi:peptidoglycan-binding domain-containing protein [Amphritea sp. HPY]|uniref:peptidoglycan-binding domain-containing protein n=1 Tax=Amphritea sp. HPY TaxID=3421652 RepID=UPI003D7E2BE9